MTSIVVISKNKCNNVNQGMFGLIKENHDQNLDLKDLVSEYDIYSFCEHNHYHVHKFLGAQIRYVGEQKGVQFTIWAPFAKSISIVANFNSWNTKSHELIKIHDSGIWSNWFPLEFSEVQYQYAIHQHNDEVKYINDPIAGQLDFSARFCSVLKCTEQYRWGDHSWISAREVNEFARKPISILSLDLATVDKNDNVTYQSIAKDMVEQARRFGFTHVEISNFVEELVDFSLQSNDGIVHKEHYYFAANSGFGDKDDFKCLIDYCHKNNIAVILKLPYFSAESFSNINSYKLLEKKQHFNYYLSNAIYWLEEFHIDGFNFSDIEFNINSKRLASIKELFQALTQTIHSRANGVFTLISATENYNHVTKPAYLNGLGINLKIAQNVVPEINDYLSNESKENSPAHFGIITASLFSENTVLNINSLLYDRNSPEIIKIILGLFFLLPSKKVIDYDFVTDIQNQYLLEYLKDINSLYVGSKSLYESDFKATCFEWNSAFDRKYISFVRWSNDYKDSYIVVVNFSDEELLNQRIAVPDTGFYLQIINSDHQKFGGTGLDNEDGVYSSNTAEAGRTYSIVIDVAPKSIIIFKKQ